MRQLQAEQSEQTKLDGQQNDLSLKLEVIVRALTNLALPSVFNRPAMAEKDFEIWNWYLRNFSADEVMYAFDAWGRTGSEFPTPNDIIEIATAYRITNNSTYKGDLPESRGKLKDNWIVLSLAFTKVCDRANQYRDAKKPYEPLSEHEMDVLLAVCREEVARRNKR